ncbi:unnamed protein product [Sympodiomycopsis kandeliae]
MHFLRFLLAVTLIVLLSQSALIECGPVRQQESRSFLAGSVDVNERRFIKSAWKSVKNSVVGCCRGQQAVVGQPYVERPTPSGTSMSSSHRVPKASSSPSSSPSRWGPLLDSTSPEVSTPPLSGASSPHSLQAGGSPGRQSKGKMSAAQHPSTSGGSPGRMSTSGAGPSGTKEHGG